MDKAYQNLAQYYDYLQREMNYEKWINWVLNTCPDRNIKILEVGCGTGYVADRLYENGYHNIDAFDLSDEMIKCAKERNDAINFYTDNATTFEVATKYDLVICFMDTFNYIIEDKDIKQTFKNFKKAIKDNGVILMDIHQNDNLENFDGYLETGYTDNDVEYVWHSHVYDYDKRVIFHDFRFIDKDDEVKERHTQRIVPIEFYKNYFDKEFKNVKITMDDYRFYLEFRK